jgi:hypothetical protein
VALSHRLLPLVLIACSTPSLAGDDLPPGHPGPRWTPAGPEGGTVTALLVDPEDPRLVLAATAGSGVFLSTDRGITWSALVESPAGIFDLSPEVPEGFLHVVREIHRGSEGDLFLAGVAGTIHRLPSGGGSYEGAWDDLSIPPFERSPVTLAVDPLSPGVAYAGSFFGLAKRDGAGFSLLPGFPSDPGDPGDPLEILDLTFDAAGSTLWAATVDGVHRSSDGGDTWQDASGGLAPAERRVRALAAATGVPGRLYAAAQIGFYATTDGGDHWTMVGFSPGFVRSLVVDPVDSEKLWAVVPGSLEVSADGGATWNLVTGLQDGVESVAVDPSGSGRVYAGGAGGVHRSVDGGATWNRVNSGLHAHQVVDLDARPEIPGRVLIATRAGRLYRSTDSGPPWGIVAIEFNSVASSPADPDRVYGSALGMVRRSFDGGATWETASAFPEHMLLQVWVHPGDPDVVFVAGRLIVPFGEIPTTLFRSADGGTTWETVWSTEAEVVVHDLEFGPGVPGAPPVALFTTTAGFLLGVDVLRSVDGGVTWEEADTSFFEEFNVLRDLAADPRRPGRFLGCCASFGPLETLDAGGSWHLFGFGLPGADRLLFDPTTPGTVYAASNFAGSFRSVDDGATWFPIGGARTDRLGGTLDLAVTGDPPSLFAGTDRGVWALRADTSPCAPDDVTLCLAGGRFEVRVQWQDFQGGAGPGHAVPLTGNTGAFWFFRESNLELAVKLLDGRGVNGFWWVFNGSLSNVPFTLAVRDTETGAERFYPNLPRTFASRGDTRGFEDPAPVPAGGSAGLAVPVAAADPSGGGFAALVAAEPPAGVATAPGASGGTCVPNDTALCLTGGRFRVEVEWEDFDGGSGPGRVHPLTGDTGAFWFFHPSNLELFVKVLDARAVNGHWWVFYGSLSNVPFTLTVTDTVTGTAKTYENPPRTFASRGDTTAF